MEKDAFKKVKWLHFAKIGNKMTLFFS